MKLASAGFGRNCRCRSEYCGGFTDQQPYRHGVLVLLDCPGLSNCGPRRIHNSFVHGEFCFVFLLCARFACEFRMRGGLVSREVNRGPLSSPSRHSRAVPCNSAGPDNHHIPLCLGKLLVFHHRNSLRPHQSSRESKLIDSITPP